MVAKAAIPACHSDLYRTSVTKEVHISLKQVNSFSRSATHLHDIAQAEPPLALVLRRTTVHEQLGEHGMNRGSFACQAPTSAKWMPFRAASLRALVVISFARRLVCAAHVFVALPNAGPEHFVASYVRKLRSWCNRAFAPNPRSRLRAHYTCSPKSADCRGSLSGSSQAHSKYP